MYISFILKSVLRYKIVVMDTYYPDTLHLREEGCEDQWLFSKTKGVHHQKRLGNTGLENRSMLDIVSVQRGDILDWFLNDGVSVAAARIRAEESSPHQVDILPTQKAQVYFNVKLSGKINVDSNRAALKWFLWARVFN